MLLGPQSHQGQGEPGAESGEAMEAGMAGRADSNEPLAFVETGSAVVDMKGAGHPAGTATSAIAVKNLFPQAGEALAGMGEGAVAGAAAAGDGG